MAIRVGDAGCAVAMILIAAIVNCMFPPPFTYVLFGAVAWSYLTILSRIVIANTPPEIVVNFWEFDDYQPSWSRERPRYRR